MGKLDELQFKDFKLYGRHGSICKAYIETYLKGLKAAQSAHAIQAVGEDIYEEIPKILKENPELQKELEADNKLIQELNNTLKSSKATIKAKIKARENLKKIEETQNLKMLNIVLQQKPEIGRKIVQANFEFNPNSIQNDRTLINIKYDLIEEFLEMKNLDKHIAEELTINEVDEIIKLIQTEKGNGFLQEDIDFFMSTLS